MAQRRNRNSIPRVNPNPRPPNEPKFGLKQAQPVRSRVGIGQAQPARGKKQQPKKPRITSESYSVTPSAPPSGGSAQFAAPVDPRDAKYWQDKAQLDFNRELRERQLSTEDIFEGTQFEKGLAQRQYEEPREVQRLREQANVGGTIYSTATQENLGNLAQQQFAQRAAMEEARKRAIAERAMNKKELEDRYTEGLGNIMETAAERASRQELERPGPYEPYQETPTEQALKRKTQPKHKQQRRRKRRK